MIGENEIAAARSSAGDILEDRREQIFVPPAASMAPPPAPSPIVMPPPPPPAPVIVDAGPRQAPVEVVENNYYREASPSRTSTTSSWESHHHRHDSGAMTLAERPRSHSRGGREIRAEIRALERELQHRPKDVGVEREIVRAERLPDGQLVVYEESVEKVVATHKPPRLEKDKKGRMSISVPKNR